MNSKTTTLYQAMLGINQLTGEEMGNKIMRQRKKVRKLAMMAAHVAGAGSEEDKSHLIDLLIILFGTSLGLGGLCRVTTPLAARRRSST